LKALLIIIAFALMIAFPFVVLAEFAPPKVVAEVAVPKAIVETAVWDKLYDHEKKRLIELLANGVRRIDNCYGIRYDTEDSGYSVRIYLKCDTIKKEA